MAYFAHAFKKVFIGETFITDGGVKPQDLQWGEFGFFDAMTWESVPIDEANIVSHPKVVFASGNFHSVDKVGGVGGLRESFKSQVIDPRFINKFWKVEARSGQRQMVRVGWDTVNVGTAPRFLCGQTYRLRIDVKGSSALRTVGHNLFHVFDVYTGCCADAGNPVAVDPIWVMVEFARQINEHPIFSQFISAGVVTADGPDFGSAPDFVDMEDYVALTDGAAIDAALASLLLVVQYEDTEFYSCATDILDHFELEPLVITSAQLVDEGGDVCAGFKQLAFTEFLAPRAPQGSGAQVFRDFVMSLSYKQERFSSDVRLREVMDLHLVTPELVSIPSVYDTYYILHGVPRRSNPSGVYDGDQYLIQLHGLEYVDFSDFVSWMESYLESAGRGVVMKDFSGEMP